MSYIQFKLTETGKAATLIAENGAVGFGLRSIRFSSSRLNMSTLEQNTGLLNVVHTQAIPPNSSIQKGNILQVFIKVQATQELSIGSMGLYTENGTLLAVASVTSGLLFKLYPNIPFVLVAVIILIDESLPFYTARIDANASLMQVILQAHTAAANPHPMYLDNALLQAEQEMVNSIIANFFHVGVWIGTDNVNFNPSAVLFSLLGIRTIWRLRPHAPLGRANTNQSINALADFAGSGDHSKINTTLIWERMPDNYRDPVITLTASAEWISEGSSAVIFTLQTSNIPQGTVYQYRITGTVNAADIDKALSGSMTIDANGRAAISISAIADKVTEGPEQLTFSILNEPNLSITIPVLDLSTTPVIYTTSDFVRITNASPSSPKFVYLTILENLSGWLAPDKKYRVLQSDVLGYVMSPYQVTRYYNDNSFWFRIIVDQVQRSGLYKFIDRIPRSSAYFIPLEGGGMLVDIRKILQDRGFSSDGLLRFGSDRTVDVMFGIAHDDYYDSGLGGTLAVPLGHGRMNY